MITLLNEKSGYLMNDIPVEPIKYTTAILTYGNILDPENWKILEVPLSYIKCKSTSTDELHKLEVEWINEEHTINYFNTVSFK